MRGGKSSQCSALLHTTQPIPAVILYSSSLMPQTFLRVLPTASTLCLLGVLVNFQIYYLGDVSLSMGNLQGLGLEQYLEA